MIAKPNLKQLQQRINYYFSDDTLLETALTHRSYSSTNNERLEFLGDSLLGVTISQQLFEQFPDLKEGVLSRQRSRLVKGVTLAALAREFSLSDYLIMGSGELKSGGFRRDSILADTVEAIIGAIFIDSDIQQCQEVILQWFDERLQSLSSDDQLKDPKTRLQELLQSKKKPLPIYTVANIEGASHEQRFTVDCGIALLDTAVTATAGSRRQAEQEAATTVLKLLNDELK
ncbi:MAG: ribonuclease-3 [Candidatus Endobugula sp.]